MAGGGLVEEGTPGELLVRADSAYARLMSAQVVDEAPAQVDYASPAAAAEVAAPRPTSAAAGGRELPAIRLWGRLLQLVRPRAWGAAPGLGLGPLHALSQVALGVVSAVLVAQVFVRGDLTPWLIGLAFLVPITAVLRWLDSWISHDLAYRLLAELRIRLYQVLDPLAPAYL